jgi:O-antigen ligase
VPLFFSRFDAQAGSVDGETGIGLHNAFLQIYFETGIAGLITFTFLMSAIVLKLIAALNKDFAGSFTMLTVCAGYAIVFYYDNLLGYLQFQWFFWFTLGSVCASGGFAAVSCPIPTPGIPSASSTNGVVPASH